MHIHQLGQGFRIISAEIGGKIFMLISTHISGFQNSKVLFKFFGGTTRKAYISVEAGVHWLVTTDFHSSEHTITSSNTTYFMWRHTYSV